MPLTIPEVKVGQTVTVREKVYVFDGTTADDFNSLAKVLRAGGSAKLLDVKVNMRLGNTLSRTPSATFDFGDFEDIPMGDLIIALGGSLQ